MAVPAVAPRDLRCTRGTTVPCYACPTHLAVVAASSKLNGAAHNKRFALAPSRRRRFRMNCPSIGFKHASVRRFSFYAVRV